MAAVVAGYRLLMRLRTGGMAEVYLGQTAGGARVAIKRLLPHVESDPRFARALRDEALIGARLRHPSIVRVLDYVHDQGREHLVMEYVEGTTLAQLRDRRPPLSASAGLIAEAAAALHHAHTRHVTHGDITPANLLVTVDAAGGAHLKICDFGLARDLRIPAPRPVSGSPAYLAPEQAGGLPGDERSDLYSLSVCAWELVTGRRLHPRASSDSVRDSSATLARVRRAQVPSLAVLASAPRLAQVLGAALQPDPALRLRGAAILAAAFRAWSVLPSHREEARRFWLSEGDGVPEEISPSTEITVTAVA